MTISTAPAKEWSKHNGGHDDPRFNSCSPNLEQIEIWMKAQWPRHGNFFGIEDLGCYGERSVRDGFVPSAHASGAAKDLRYMSGLDFTWFDLNRTLCMNVIIPTLITNSLELHLGAIHDYVGGRIWHSGRTPNVADAFTKWWRPNSGSNMGFQYAGWLHLETTEPGWGDSTPITARPLTFVPTSPIPTPTPPPILEDDDMSQMILYRDRRFDNVFRVGDSAVTIGGEILAHDQKVNVDEVFGLHDQSLIAYMRTSGLRAGQMVPNGEFVAEAQAFLNALPPDLK